MIYDEHEIIFINLINTERLMNLNMRDQVQMKDN